MTPDSYPVQSIAALAAMPPQYAGHLDETIRREMAHTSLIVLDDDPTGTQTVYQVPVLTEWSAEVILGELTRKTPVFFVLTNSRSLPDAEAAALAFSIGENVQKAAALSQRKYQLISRGDSTLRGHFPTEVNALQEGAGMHGALHVIIPAFIDGGRYTFDDVHYVKEGSELTPVARTPFANDKKFGYKSSNLRNWVEEKTGGKVRADDVVSFSIDDLRVKGVAFVEQKLRDLTAGTTCVVNAISRSDLDVFALALMRSDIPSICRTGASFVAAMAGLPARPLLRVDELNLTPGGGGLVVVGSYVPKSTTQLEALLNTGHVSPLELDVSALVHGQTSARLIDEFARRTEDLMAQGKDVVLYTSRTLISGASGDESLKIGQTVSEAVTGIIRALTRIPRFLIAKGGITSSDIATKALGVKRAMVQGQIQAGVPVWKLGEESRFPGLCYVVFPGNVGEPDSLKELVAAFNTRRHG